ncbi:MAG TPA: MFS transporter [Gemmataceae bacterium]|nr:MFS transporter [Gemmataceae bacterium]
MATALAPLPCSATTLPHRHIRHLSARSRIGLSAASFFLAEIGGVVVPFLSKYLVERGWSDSSVGVAISLGGLGVFLMQTPAGFLVDRIRQRRALLAGASIAVGLCFGLLPLLPPWWGCLDPLLFLAGMSRSFFGPLLGALALGLAGHAGLNRLMGTAQSCDHAGNFASALVAISLLAWLPVTSIFYAVAAVSLLAAVSIFVIRGGEVDDELARGGTRNGHSPAGFLTLLRDRRVAILFAAVALFHLANAPVMPLVGLYIARLGGTNTQVACVVLTAQAVMIPVAWLAGRLGERWGRKPVFAIGFLVLPLRIFLYSLTDSPWMLVMLQTLDGIGAGIYGVVIVAMCADLTRGTGRFNALQGLIATALSAGGVVGPVLAGFVVQYFGFAAAFYLFAAIAAVAAFVFVLFMPETKESLASPQRQQGLEVSLAGAAGW